MSQNESFDNILEKHSEIIEHSDVSAKELEGKMTFRQLIETFYGNPTTKYCSFIASAIVGM